MQLFSQIIEVSSAHWIDALIQADKKLFQLINSKFTTPWLDSIYPWYRESTTWVPLYLFILVFLFLNFGKRVWPWLLFVIFNIMLSDQISSTFFKHQFMRLRPCADPYLQFNVRLLLDHCSGGYSFTSSHATNHFGFAMFLLQTLKPFINKFKWPLYFWAASISYGQIYVGVHYPLDVFVGALLGCGIGYMVASFYNRRVAIHYPLIIPDT
ncbi:phosphatase PAP2 family protein [Parasediminibacterium sp. JCM 36343]|uniref:phosphatase PAP2 family protein n=1 Tax=Parasediminibacterium sp. JCM 36343 TaxID=3374279 RepID=UPI0039789A79